MVPLHGPTNQHYGKQGEGRKRKEGIGKRRNEEEGEEKGRKRKEGERRGGMRREERRRGGRGRKKRGGLFSRFTSILVSPAL